jgi:putative transposase
MAHRHGEDFKREAVRLALSIGLSQSQVAADLGIGVGHRRVGRLMRENNIRVVRTRKHKATTDSNHRFNISPNLLDQDFSASAPSQKWAGDISYIWTREGWLYLAVNLDLYSRRVIGWAVSNRMKKGLPIRALEMAINLRKPAPGCIHHTDRGSQYLSIKYTERLAEAGLEPSVGSVGDSYDNALAETINGLHNAEVIHRTGPWKSMDAVEYAALIWVDWFSNHRLLGPIGHIPPAEAEANYYAALKETAIAA